MARIVVVGGVAAGTSAASQAKRRRSDAEVILLERGPFVSYGACGLPYNLQDASLPVEDLIAISAERFRQERHLDVRLRSEVTSIEPAAQRVHVRDLAGDREYALTYDELVLATGARAVYLEVPGAELPGVHELRELTDGDELKRALAEGARRAVLVGGGYINMELAETMRARGLEVTMLERGQPLLRGFAPELAGHVHDELVRQGVRVETGVELKSIVRASGGAAHLTAHTARGSFDGDVIIIAVGIQPNVELARAAGVKLGRTGAIAVSDRQETNVPHIWAAGDCAEATHLVSGEQVWVPLGTTANKQGKTAGANVVGADERFLGIVGTSAFKVFDLEVARTGLSAAELDRLGLPFRKALSKQASRASSFGAPQPIHTMLYFAPDDGRLLGAQMVGREGVAHRIDVYAAALHARMTVSQIEALDLAYAPPFAPVYDPILIAATVARKALEEA